MSIHDIMEDLKSIQNNILNFLEEESNLDEQSEPLDRMLPKNILQDRHKVKLIVYLIVNIFNNYQHNKDFYLKIDQILNHFVPAIKNYYSNNEIFNFFKTNKRLLLFLFDNNVITMNSYILETITKGKYKSENYPEYFYPEIEIYLNQQTTDKNYKNKYSRLMKRLKSGQYKNHEEYRKIGENDDYICRFIRDDLIDEFVAHVSQTGISLNSTIKPSIYETNNFLLQKEQKVTLIEYSFFYGSIQIVNFLKLNEIKLEQSMLPYAIHGHNLDLIHFFDAKNEEQFNVNFFYEAIKCHHNDIAGYFKNNFMNNEPRNQMDESIKYYNFEFIYEDEFYSSTYFLFFQYDYCYLIEKLLENDIQGKINACVLYKREGKTALEIILENENIDMINILINNKNIKGPIIQEALYFSILYHKTEIAKTVIENDRFDINYVYNKQIDNDKEKKKMTALCLAIEQEENDIAKLLLMKDGIDVNVPYTNIYGNTVYRMNIDENSVKTSKKDGYDEKTPLFLAIEKQNVELVDLLLKNKSIDVNKINRFDCATKVKIKKQGSTTWYINYLNITKELHEKTALFLAVEKGNIEIVKLLLSKDEIDVSIINKKEFFQDNTESKKWGNNLIYEKDVLFLAIENDNFEIVKLLLKNSKTNYAINNSNREEMQCLERSLTYNKDKNLIENVGGNLEMVKTILSKIEFDKNNSHKLVNLHLDFSYKYEKNALSMAMEKGNLEIVKLLIDINDIDINKVFKESIDGECEIEEDKKNKIYKGYTTTPLYFAVEQEDIEMIKCLLTNEKIDTNAYNSYVSNQLYQTEEYSKVALLLAIEKGNLEIIKLLLSKDQTDIHCINKYKSLFCNIESDDKRNKEKKLVVYEKTCLLLAFEKYNHSEIIKTFMEKPYKNVINKYRKEYIQFGDIEEKESKEEKEYYEKTLLFMLVEKGDTEMVKLLLLNGNIDINIINKYEHKTNDKYEYFYEVVNRNRYEKNVLYAAVENENTEIVKILLNIEDIDVNFLNKKNEMIYEEMRNSKSEETALYTAIDKSNLEIVDLLLSNNKIDVNIMNKYEDDDENYEYTALYFAVDKGEIKIIESLLTKENIEINKLNKYEDEEKTALHNAVNNKNMNIIDILLRNKNIDIKVKDGRGNTPVDITEDEEIKLKLTNHKIIK
ncbi:hypothetical protein M9Y10_032373 [Tritrichomonas musculus]|uniref:Ankyrin n=1 Tax=Tritrichomonas musculus TaxID=1915356 RepID=A0ABR2GY92_9EUKA